LKKAGIDIVAVGECLIDFANAAGSFATTKKALSRPYRMKNKSKTI
jgi:hypothetical protein